MLLTTNLYQTAKLSLNSKTKIVFNENIELSVAVRSKNSSNYALHIEDVKGSYTNLKIGPTNSPCYLRYDSSKKCYPTTFDELQKPYNFVVECKAEFKSVMYARWPTRLTCSADLLKFMNIFECFENTLYVSNYKFYKLQYYIKKVTANLVEVTIENPHMLQINGQKNDYTYTSCVTSDLNLNLSIVFDPKVMEILDENAKDGISEFLKPQSNNSTEPVIVQFDCSKEAEIEEDETISSDNKVVEQTTQEQSPTSEDKSADGIQNDEEVTAENSNEVVKETLCDNTTSNSNVIVTVTENHIPVDSSFETQSPKKIVSSTDKLNTASKGPRLFRFDSASTQMYRKMPVEEFIADVLDISVDDLRSSRKKLLSAESHVSIDATQQAMEEQTTESNDIRNEELNETSNLLDKVSSDETSELFEDHIPVDSSPETSEKQTREKTVTTNDIPYETSKPTLDPSAIQINDYVILISSDGQRIYSSASLLTRHSYVFTTILKKIKKSPVKINLEEFDAETIYAALDFLNGKTDVIKGKEIQLYHFAEKYSLRDLKNACCTKLDKILCLENACDIIEIAYANYFEELKLKCIKLIIEKQNEIYQRKLEKLSTNIVEDIVHFHDFGTI